MLNLKITELVRVSLCETLGLSDKEQTEEVIRSLIVLSGCDLVVNFFSENSENLKKKFKAQVKEIIFPKLIDPDYLHYILNFYSQRNYPVKFILALIKLAKEEENKEAVAVLKNRYADYLGKSSTFSCFGKNRSGRGIVLPRSASRMNPEQSKKIVKLLSSMFENNLRCKTREIVRLLYPELFQDKNLGRLEIHSPPGQQVKKLQKYAIL